MTQSTTAEQVRIVRSFIAANSLATLIQANYDLGDNVSCKMFSKLLRTQDNDHYLVDAGNGQMYVARIYQNGDHLGRSLDDYLFELEWLNYLKDNDFPVSYPIQRKDGAYIGSLDTPEGIRYFALFTLARGEALSTRNENHLFAMGANMARLHSLSAGFQPRHKRFATDLNHLLAEPMTHIRGFWAKQQTELELLEVSAQELRTEIEELLGPADPETGYWGIIGGDFHPGNVRFDDQDQPTFFNFDLCGPGWFAYDIAAFLANADMLEAPEQYSEAFFGGYYSVRPLAEVEHEAIAAFLSVRRIWLMGSFAVEDGLAGFTFIAPA